VRQCFKKAHVLVRSEVFYSILIEFGIPMKLVRLIKMCLNEKYSPFRTVRHLYDMFTFNLLSPELNSICYLLALLAHDFLHVSRIRVKSLTLRLLMTYIYDISHLRVKHILKQEHVLSPLLLSFVL
jgi:hypothetical protein